MSPKLLKSVAVAMLALAIAALGAALWVSNQRVHIQGPSALAVLADQSVWLSVDDALWHLDAQGRRAATADARTLGQGGLSGLIGNLVVHPNGQLVASVRDDPTLYFLDPASGKVLSRLSPQWPADLREHAARAITYAFHGDGRVAISTGGGHAVAVFDGQGGFLMRTAPNTYEFTNGLWWTDDSLWTTNTNGMALLELDAHTLALKSQVHASHALGGWRFLGMAVASGGKPAQAGQPAPLATLVRFANGMVQGHATDVLRDGSQINFPVAATLEPRDIKWRGGELLLVDGASYAIKRYSDSRVPLADFGAPAVRAGLSDLLARRESLQTQYYAGLAMAIMLFVVGFAAAVGAQRLEKRQALAALAVDLSQMGTPRLSRQRYVQLTLKMYWPTLALMAAAVLLGPAWRAFPAFAKAASTPLLLGKTVCVLLALYLLVRTTWRSMQDPESEAFFNYRAMNFLETDLAFWRLLNNGERPRETLIMVGGRRGLQWLVLTNQRLLLFVGNLKERTLLEQYPRRTVTGMRLLEPQELAWLQRLQRLLSLGSVTMRVAFKDGSTLQGTATSAATARRMAALLQTSAFDASSISQMGQALREPARPRAGVPGLHIAIRQTLASLLVPGLGQWMQRRGATALRFFLFWALGVVFLVVPLVWTLWAPRAAVSLGTTVYIAAMYGVVCLLAAADAWRLQVRQRA